MCKYQEHFDFPFHDPSKASFSVGRSPTIKSMIHCCKTKSPAWIVFIATEPAEQLSFLLGVIWYTIQEAYLPTPRGCQRFPSLCIRGCVGRALWEWCTPEAAGLHLPFHCQSTRGGPTLAGWRCHWCHPTLPQCPPPRSLEWGGRRGDDPAWPGCSPKRQKKPQMKCCFAVSHSCCLSVEAGEKFILFYVWNWNLSLVEFNDSLFYFCCSMLILC